MLLSFPKIKHVPLAVISQQQTTWKWKRKTKTVDPYKFSWKWRPKENERCGRYEGVGSFHRVKASVHVLWCNTSQRIQKSLAGNGINFTAWSLVYHFQKMRILYIRKKPQSWASSLAGPRRVFPLQLWEGKSQGIFW